MDNRQNRTTTSNDRPHAATQVSLTLLPLELAELDKQSRSYVYGIPASAPPARIRSHILFGPTELHNSSAHEQIFTATFTPTKVADILEEEEVEQDVAITDNQQRGLHTILTEEREEEIRELTRMVSQRPSDDEAARSILNQLDLILNEIDTAAVTSMDVDNNDREQNASLSTTDQPPYPPTNRSGLVQDHDRPYAQYGSLDRDAISQSCNFNFTTMPNLSNQSQNRYRRKSYAIVAQTNVAKEDLRQYIINEFGKNKIQYICIGDETGQPSGNPSLIIQIIFKDKIDRRKPFLQDFVGTSCNYEAADDDLAWNEYIKKNGGCVEYGTFKSIQRLSTIEWESLPASASGTSAALFVPDTPLNQQSSSVQSRRIATKRPPTVSAQVEKRRKIDDDITRMALALAEDSVEAAMDYIREEMPSKFVQHRKWYLDAFRYVHLRAEEKADRAGTIDKEYVWPDSFPDCTPKLRDAIDRWIKHHFFRAKRAKCLVLIGPSGTGKTSFALSLPGRVNYFQGQFNRDKWTDYARYSVYDDIPWDQFEKTGYPLKRNFLTQNGELETNYKYQEIATINVRQPAIVLLNPENAGSLLTKAKTKTEKQEAAYWEARATVYTMEADEYFFKPHLHGPHSATSITSSIGSNEARLGGPDEFDKMREQYYAKHGNP